MAGKECGTDGTQRLLFWLICAGLAGLLAAGVLLWFFPDRFPKITKPCVFYSLTGFFCPGCYGTRAVKAMLSGRFLLSLYYSPVVLYTTVMGILAVILRIKAKITHTTGMRYRDRYLVIFMILFLGNWIVKNISLHLFHIMP